MAAAWDDAQVRAGQQTVQRAAGHVRHLRQMHTSVVESVSLSILNIRHIPLAAYACMRGRMQEPCSATHRLQAILRTLLSLKPMTKQRNTHLQVASAVPEVRGGGELGGDGRHVVRPGLAQEYGQVLKQRRAAALPQALRHDGLPRDRR